jgi:hypothetical protein
MNNIRHPKILAIAMSAIALAAAAEARARPDLPGRAPSKVTMTAIFSVSSAHSKDSLYRAVITCDLGRQKKRKMTDRTGTAPVSFTIERSAGRAGRKAECIINRNGYLPAYKSIEFPEVPAPKLVKVEMTPQ